MNDNNPQVLTRRKWLSAVSTPALAAAILPLQARAAAGESSAPTGNDAGARVYNIRDFGAKGDGQTLDSPALQAAIDACTKDGGGTVLVPAGTFVIGTTELKSNVTLHVAASATLLGSGNGKDYHAVDAIPLEGDSTLGDGNWALLFAVNAKNVTVEGPGTIDGQGQLFFSYSQAGKPPAAGIGGAQRPYHLLFHRCENIVVRDLDLLRCAFHSIRVIQSQRVRMEGLYIHNRVNVNNDGFHFISAKYVTISNCVVLCQDDACALFGSCQFVTVTNCVFSTRWSVFRFGGGDVKNIAVSNCIIYETYGCPIKVGAGRMRLENLSFSNLILQNVTGPISINFTPRGRGEWGQGRPPTAEELTKFDANKDGKLDPTEWAALRAERAATISPRDLARYDANKNGKLDPEEMTARQADRDKAAAAYAAQEVEAPYVRNISFSNIRATLATEPTMTYKDMALIGRVYPGEQNSCITLNGAGDAWIENVSFSDVHVTSAGGGTAELAAKRQIPQSGGEYFGVWSEAPYGPPAYGIFARNVKGLTLHNVRFDAAKPDLRPAVVFNHVRDVAINGLSAQGNEQGESVLRFTDVTDALLTASRVLTPVPVFLQLEGQGNSGVTVDGGDLAKAAQPLALKDGATAKAAKLRI
jgi:polygalacturonase